MPGKTKQMLLIRCAIIYEKEKSFCLSSKTCAKKLFKAIKLLVYYSCLQTTSRYVCTSSLPQAV